MKLKTHLLVLLMPPSAVRSPLRRTGTPGLMISIPMPKSAPRQWWSMAASCFASAGSPVSPPWRAPRPLPGASITAAPILRVRDGASAGLLPDALSLLGYALLAVLAVCIYRLHRIYVTKRAPPPDAAD